MISNIWVIDKCAYAYQVICGEGMLIPRIDLMFVLMTNYCIVLMTNYAIDHQKGKSYNSSIQMQKFLGVYWYVVYL